MKNQEQQTFEKNEEMPIKNIVLPALPKELFPTPWRQFDNFNSQNCHYYIEEPQQREINFHFQIDKLEKRYSKVSRRRLKSDGESGEIMIDSHSVESRLLRGNRFQFNQNLDIDYVEQPTSNLPLIKAHDLVKIGQFSVSKEIACSKYTNTPQKKTQPKFIFSSPSKQFATRKFGEIDNLVERVRLQQVDILKKHNAKGFSKDVQQKLKDEMFIILKSFQ